MIFQKWGKVAGSYAQLQDGPTAEPPGGWAYLQCIWTAQARPLQGSITILHHQFPLKA